MLSNYAPWDDLLKGSDLDFFLGVKKGEKHRTFLETVNVISY